MLYVVRHGETDYNVARICGHAEAQLTEKGYQQAELVAEKLPNKEFKSTVYWRRL